MFYVSVSTGEYGQSMRFIFCHAIGRGPSALALDLRISRPDVWHLFRRTDCNMESIGLELVVRQFPYSSASMTDHSGFWLVLAAAWFWSGSSHVPHRKVKQEGQTGSVISCGDQVLWCGYRVAPEISTCDLLLQIFRQVCKTDTL